MATKNKIVEVEVNHTIDEMIAFQTIWISSMKAQRGMSAQEIEALSICEDILKVLQMSKQIGKHQGFGN
jgi:hypothetical protein